MRYAQMLVERFHRLMGQPVGDKANPALSRTDLRLKLIKEELEELEDAIERGDLIAAADALADLGYVTIGSAVEWGIDLQPMFEEVHRSNMQKRWPDGETRYRPDGKVLKPPGWRAPDLELVLEEQIKHHRSHADAVDGATDAALTERN